MGELLEKARAYERDRKVLADAQRPKIHATGMVGWINDPNGFSVYKGEYHLFYQYYPYALEWGPMHWGHLKTADFVRWEWLPVALAPEEEYENHGCFSGSAIELSDGRQLLLYTGASRRDVEGEIKEYQEQCIAIGDGLNYVKCHSNPVIPKEMLPKGANIHDFRDPKIWMEDDTFYALMVNREKGGNGVVLLYESKDLQNWSFTTTLAKGGDKYGEMWECPDFFSLNAQDVLVVSAIGLKEGNVGLAFLGEYDKETHTFSERKVETLDYGPDFYAPQTLEAVDGRRILIAWMKNWETCKAYSEGVMLNGSMTFPRELTTQNGKLFQRPVRELLEYRTNSKTYENLRLEGAQSFDLTGGDTLDLEITLEPEGDAYTEFKVTLGKGEAQSLFLCYDVSNQKITMERKLLVPNKKNLDCREMPIGNHEGRMQMRILLDGESIEIFVNDGEQVATFLLFGATRSKTITFEVDKGAKLQFEKHEIIVEGEL